MSTAEKILIAILFVGMIVLVAHAAHEFYQSQVLIQQQCAAMIFR